MINHPDSFFRMAINAVVGAFLGLLFGLLIGLVILFIGGLIPPFVGSEGPHQIAPFLGMGFGSFVGAIFGGIVGLKK